MWNHDVHLVYMREALEVAECCRDIEWYGVGCLIVSSRGEMLSTGYTGELKESDGKFRHAEDVAIEKAGLKGQDLKGAVLYSTLEPCSVRSSGKTPCIHHILNAKIGVVVFGAKEPYDPKLNIVCQGSSLLTQNGITVIQIQETEQLCLASIISKRKAN